MKWVDLSDALGKCILEEVIKGDKFTKNIMDLRCMDYPTFRKTAFCRFGSVLKTSDLALAKEIFIKQKTCRLGVLL